MKIDPKIDPSKVSELKKKYGEVKYCCKCHKVVGDHDEDYYYYEGEGFYCINCNYVVKNP